MRKSTMKRNPQAVRVACAAATLVAAFGATPASAQLSDAAAPPSPRIELGRVESYFNDSMLTAKVKLALLDAPDVSALDIGVQTNRGVVQLSGFVDDAQRARRAAEIAGRVQGVTAVRNAILVKGQAS